MTETPLRGRNHPNYRHGFHSGYTEWRYGPVDLPKRPHRRILRGKDRRSVVSRIVGILRGWRFSHFQHEGSTRAGLRSSLCMAGHSWHAADREAADIVDEALSSIGAKRPSWYAGQPEYTTPADHCQRCGLPLHEAGRGWSKRFCSEVCRDSARLYREEVYRLVERSSYSRAYAAVIRARNDPRACQICGTVFTPLRSEATTCSRECTWKARDAYVPPRPCDHCGTEFKPYGSRSRFCSISCSNLARRNSLPERPCVNCGEMFQPAVSHAMLCSKDCSRRWERARRKARESAAGGRQYGCEALE